MRSRLHPIMASIAFALVLVPLDCAAQADEVIEALSPDSLEEQLYFSREEMVTGATKRPVPLGEAPANVTVITHEDIIQSGAQNIAEVFRRVPGMDVFWVDSAEEEVSLRGFAGPVLEAQRMAVLIDGRTFYQEFLSSTMWSQIPVPLDDIKRIEVIKGPMSSLHGNKAMLGIINIVTYEPEETNTKLGGGGGMHWMGTGEFIHAGKFSDGYWYKVTGNYIRNDEYSDRMNDGSTKARENLALTGRFVAQPFDSTRASITATGSQNYQLMQIGGIARWNERIGTVEGRIDHDFGRWGDLHFHGYWQRFYGSSPDFPALGTLVADIVDSEVRHTISFDITPNIENTLTYGFNYRFADISNKPVQSINDFAGFMQDEFRFYDRIIFTAGARVDYQRDFAGLNTAAHGSVVAIVHPTYYTFRVGLGTAFNTPHYSEYYFNLAAPATGGINLIGNRGLTAERILYVDVGNTVYPVDGLTLFADFFYYRLNNMLTPAMRPLVVTPTVLFVNDGGAEAIGGEVGMNGEFFDWLSAYASWSYQKFRAINGNANATPNLGNPKNKVSSGFRCLFLEGRLTLNVDFNYVRHYQRQNGIVNFQNSPAVRVDDFYLLNARLAFWPIRDHLEIAVAANNILDDNSPQVPMFDTTGQPVLAERPKFNLWGSLRYVF